MSTFDALVSGRWAMLPSYLDIFATVIDRGATDADRERARTLRAARQTRQAVLADHGRVLAATTGVILRDGTAIVPITGPIFRYADFFSDISGGVTVEGLARDLQVAQAASEVQRIVLWLDSPGGELTGINALAQQIAASPKPVTAYIEGLGASAAYWLAVAAGPGNLIADATAVVGSIGVVMAVPDPSKTSARDLEFVSSDSPNKRPDVLTAQGRAEVQRTVDQLGAVFVEAVAQYRGTTPARVRRDFGQGGVLVGQHAVTAGMVDQISTLEAVLTTTAPAQRRVFASATAPGSLTASAEVTPTFELGDRVQITGTPHMAGHTTGTIQQAVATVAYGLIMDGMEEMGVHKWYIQEEIAPLDAPTAAPQQPTDMPMTARSKGVGMNRFKEVFLGAFAALDEQAQATDAGAPATDVALQESLVLAAAPDAETVQLRAEVARLKAERLTADAAAFADQQIMAHKATPAERDAMIAAYTTLATDGSATALASLTALYAARPAHRLTEDVTPADATVLTSTPATPDVAARTAELLAATAVGQTALKRRQHGG